MELSELRARAGHERYFDYRRAADRDRIARLALAGRPAGVPFYRPVLAGLGRRLAAWGCGLQERYGVAQRVEPRRVRMATR